MLFVQPGPGYKLACCSWVGYGCLPLPLEVISVEEIDFFLYSRDFSHLGSGLANDSQAVSGIYFDRVNTIAHHRSHANPHYFKVTSDAGRLQDWQTRLLHQHRRSHYRIFNLIDVKSFRCSFASWVQVTEQLMGRTQARPADYPSKHRLPECKCGGIEPLPLQYRWMNETGWRS